MAVRDGWSGVPAVLRARGLRWTPQRQLVVGVLRDAEGHITGAEILARCRRRDPGTSPSTVYRTLDVLEEIGLVRHGHGADGREEYHVEPDAEHGHRYCAGCGRSWEIADAEAAAIRRAFREVDGFDVDISHVTVVGRCRSCAGG
ncbi:MAG TPA: Fur family transcriptional regulator [Candidatus Limnocylindria bacterium]|nr:Fur family transcriptional regulator [Candidatus Limnocylindria bacterium]